MENDRPIETAQPDPHIDRTSESASIEQDGRGRWWPLLNSPFILFVLTSVVLSGLSFVYEKYSSYIKTNDALIESENHLIVEVGYRLRVLSKLEKSEFSFTDLWTADAALIGERGNIDYDKDTTGQFSSIYTNFKERSLTSLLWELRDIQAKRKQQSTIDNSSFDAVDEISDIWNKGVENVKSRNSDDDSVWSQKNPETLNRLSINLTLLKRQVKQ